MGSGVARARNPVGQWVYSPVLEVEEAVARVRKSFPPLHSTNLGPFKELLQGIGNPHLRLPPVFHVAGTNGKGSVLAFLQAIYESAGRSVHKFTSPHLVRFEERIILSGQQIGSDELISLIEEMETVAQNRDISFFGFFTALAFLAFSRAGASAVLLETGLGGTYDATNVVQNPITAIVTRISADHTRVLGSDLAEIARHKAGIFKESRPAVIAPQPDKEVLDVFLRTARDKGSKPYVAGDAWEVQYGHNNFFYKSSAFSFNLPFPALPGAHQIVNAATAIAALEAAECKDFLTQDILGKAMRSVVWPGRLERLHAGALVDFLPEGWEIWLDGAHNDSGAEVLATAIAAWKDGLPLHMITAFKQKKDVESFYLPLARLVRSTFTMDGMPDAPMVKPDELAEHLRQIGYTTAEKTQNLESALRSLVFQFKTPQRILITGSLYLVGYALRRNGGRF